MSDKKALLQNIAKEEALLSRLDSEREQHFQIMDHLQDRHVIGVYPMLPDDTSWFLTGF